MNLFEEPKKLAIIGTAGRGSDAEKLTGGHFEMMVRAAYTHCLNYGFRSFVSGGAAWSDHVAVALFKYCGFKIELHLPGESQDIATAAKYHAAFSQVLGRDTLAEVALAYESNGYSLRKGTFKQRNTRVANEATHFLAMTFGDGAKVKDGGTKDTVDKMLAMGKTGWHLDLHDFSLYVVRP